MDVDYLAAAAAALRARVPLTAALLVEAWLEAEHGTVSLDDADAAAREREARAQGQGQGQARAPSGLGSGDGASESLGVPAHVRLLLEAHAGTSEPDGIYGLLRSHALPMRLRAFEHEGAWGQALVGHDVALTHGAGGGDARDSRARLADTLRRMGCLHVLDVYVRSLPPAEAAAPEVAEARFEAAWRAGRWDLGAAALDLDAKRAAAATGGARGAEAARASSPAGSDADAAGFHRGLHAALATLRSGDVADASSGLDPIRAALVRRAVVEGAEAEEVARTATVRLQMLDDVADAARLWNAFRGGSGSGSGGGAERGFLVEVHFGGDEGGASRADLSLINKYEPTRH